MLGLLWSQLYGCSPQPLAQFCVAQPYTVSSVLTRKLPLLSEHVRLGQVLLLIILSPPQCWLHPGVPNGSSKLQYLDLLGKQTGAAGNSRMQPWNHPSKKAEWNVSRSWGTLS